MKGHDEENQASPAAEVREPLHQPLVGKEDHTLAPVGRAEGARIQSPPETGHWVPPGARTNHRGRQSAPKDGECVFFKLQHLRFAVSPSLQNAAFVSLSSPAF